MIVASANGRSIQILSPQDSSMGWGRAITGQNFWPAHTFSECWKKSAASNSCNAASVGSWGSPVSAAAAWAASSRGIARYASLSRSSRTRSPLTMVTLTWGDGMIAMI